MLSFRLSEENNQEVTDAGVACLQQHVIQAKGVPFEKKPLSVLAHEDERLVGGMIGTVFWNWLYVELLWVEEEFRGRGIGRRLMIDAEKRARELRLKGIYLWTQSWQAPGFYSKVGYHPFVDFQDFPPGHRRLGFFKYLS